MNLALFDFDGTITRADTWTEFLRFSATPQRIFAASVILSPLMIGYKLGFVPARKARPLVAKVAFQGRKSIVVRRLGRKYATDVLPDLLQPRALERIAWHQAQGDTVVVVSGSLDVYLTHWCKSMHVDLICTQLEDANGTLTGKYVRGDCSGSEKRRRISERYDLARYQVIYAYGDTDEDREMLEIAHEKYYRWEKIADCSSLSATHPPVVRSKP
jgi:phosphatidylglycerophosphatase C